MVFQPNDLQKINSRNDVTFIVRKIADFLKQNSIYEPLIDALWENIEGQKKTLKDFEWENNPNFIENSSKWLTWTEATTSHISSRAAFSEELWHTLELWVSAGTQSYQRKKVLYRTKDNMPKGETLGPHFAVNKFLNIDNPSIEINPVQQLDFLETLQHERIHVFTRYWHVLKWDIPYASALGLITAQIYAEQNNIRYEAWEKVLGFDYKWRNLIKGADIGRKSEFLFSIEELQRRYINQIEDDSSYIDGYSLAVACAIYFNSVEKSRIFVELLAYGINAKEAHDIASEGNGKKEINNQYEVFDTSTYRLKMAGFWNPGNNGVLGCCAWESILRGSFQMYKNIFEDWNLEMTSLHSLLGLRGADQAEASHFTGSKSQFTYYSLPCATYSVKPLLKDDAIKLVDEIRVGCSFTKISNKFMDNLKRHGFPRSMFLQEVISPSINDPELNNLRSELLSAISTFQSMQSKLGKITMEWTKNPNLFP